MLQLRLFLLSIVVLKILAREYRTLTDLNDRPRKIQVQFTAFRILGVHMILVRANAGIATILILGLSASLQAQPNVPDLQGMWSDPPVTAEDIFCIFYCSDVGLDRLDMLLNDPENNDRPYAALNGEATRYQQEQYIVPRLTAAALATYPLDFATDPGFLYCEPWGFARQMLAPHQLDIQQYTDRIEMHYGEWDARRTIYLDDKKRPVTQPLSVYGYSLGHYEGETLVIETTRIRANRTMWRTEHSDQLRTVERYSRSEDGDRLLLSVTMEDPWSLQQPLQLKKVWSWAPDQAIFPYADCERPTEYSLGTDQTNVLLPGATQP